MHLILLVDASLTGCDVNYSAFSLWSWLLHRELEEEATFGFGFSKEKERLKNEGNLAVASAARQMLQNHALQFTITSRSRSF